MRDSGPQEISSRLTQVKGFRQTRGGGSQVELEFQQACALLAAAKQAEAETLFAVILKRYPGHFGSLYSLGIIRFQQARLEDAQGLLRRAVVSNPRSADASNSLGNALQALGRHAEAIERFRRALALHPRSPYAHNNLGNSQLALGQLEEAAASFRQAIALEPGLEVAHSNLGNTLLALCRPEEALASYETAVALRPDLAGLHCNLGKALVALNRHAEASGRFARARESLA